jgi:two-component system, chemotaxis family, chemotaxis protein CheY
MEIKALVADSSSKVRKNITRSLNEIGVRNVVEATDGNQALELLESGKFDVVFAEWSTRIGEGEELVQAARKLDGKLPIIVTAPQSKKIAELKKVCPSASNYLALPFSTEQMRKTVGEYVPSIAG